MKPMPRARIALLLFSLTLVLVGCSNLGTTPTDRLDETGVKSNEIEGLMYYLPVGKLHITGSPPAAAKSNPGTTTPTSTTGSTTPPASPASPTPFVINVSADYAVTITPVIEADQNCYYYLKPLHNWAYDDAIDIKVGSNGLLTSGNVTTTDETVNIASAVASMVSEGGISLPMTIQEVNKVSEKKTVADVMTLVRTFINATSETTMVPVDILQTLHSDMTDVCNKWGPNVPEEAKAFMLLYANSSQVQAKTLQAYLTNYKGDEALLAEVTYSHLLTALQKVINKPDKPKPFDIVVDPEDGSAITKLKTLIRTVANLDFSCEDDRVEGHAYRFPLASVDFYGQKDPYVAGVAFRPMKAWKVKLRSIVKGQELVTVDTHQIFILPDKYHTLVLAYDRMPFVAKTTNVGFTNGMLTEYGETLPSPILGALGLPKAILQALLPIPSSSAKSSAGSASH